MSTLTEGHLTEAIFEIINMVRYTIADSDIIIEYVRSKRHYLCFDKRRLQQVLLNLLSNATKF